MQGRLGKPVHRGNAERVLLRGLQRNGTKSCPHVRALLLAWIRPGASLMAARARLCPAGKHPCRCLSQSDVAPVCPLAGARC